MEQKNPVVFFEIGCKDAATTKQFYKNVFGWEPNQFGLINAEMQKGISGHINSLGHEPHNYVMIYIEVDDINAYIAKVQNAGGKRIVDPIPLPNGKQFAWVNDAEGNLIGLLTP